MDQHDTSWVEVGGRQRSQPWLHMSLLWEEGQDVQGSLPVPQREGESDSIPMNDLTKPILDR